jgi:hypothetical protein
MTPTAAGRHCAACQQTVVDFTHKTNAEILAYLAGAATSRTCGRFAAEQLERPLQRAALAAPKHWRAWLAAVVAVWGLRESLNAPASAQAATEWQARYGGGPVPASPGEQNVEKTAQDSLRADTVIRGVVLDSGTHEGLPGATVLIEGTTVGTNTNADGSFTLPVPAELARPSGVHLTVSFIGYASQNRTLAAAAVAVAQVFSLQTDIKGEVCTIVVGALQPRVLPPAPWHLRRLYYWGKYWLTRPFRQ